jgi:hypothetical protein
VSLPISSVVSLQDCGFKLTIEWLEPLLLELPLDDDEESESLLLSLLLPPFFPLFPFLEEETLEPGEEVALGESIGDFSLGVDDFVGVDFVGVAELILRGDACLAPRGRSSDIILRLSLANESLSRLL